MFTQISTASLGIGLMFVASAAIAQDYGNSCCPPVSVNSAACCDPAAANNYYSAYQQAPTVSPGRCCNPPRYVAAPQIAYRPLLPIAPTPGAIQLGYGMLGQPTAYVPGQPIRNFMRYVSPF